MIERAKAIWRLFSTGGLNKVDKWALVLALLYCLSPIDVIPDVIPFFGFLDDLLVVLMAVRRFSRRSAAEEPVAVPVEAKVL